MKVACFVFCLAIAASIGAQEKVKPRFDWEQYKRDREFTWKVLGRARQAVPRRRDAPLRELNLTDDEVREIQSATRSYLPNAYLNISPVVTGCSCEDGGGCTDQVYVLADAGGQSKGLQLSRIRNEWKVSDLQKWWLGYDRLLAERDTMDPQTYEQAELKLAREFPVCAAAVNPEAAPISARATESTK
jgi:hypothetical protein